MSPSISIGLDSTLGNPLLNAEIHRAASEAFTLVTTAPGAVRNTFKIISFSKSLWAFDRELQRILTKLQIGLENAEARPDLSKPVSRERVESAISTLRAICDVCEDLYETAKRNGWINRRFLGGPLSAIHTHTDDLRDWVESVELAFYDAARLARTFQEAAAALERGETISLTDL